MLVSKIRFSSVLKPFLRLNAIFHHLLQSLEKWTNLYLNIRIRYDKMIQCLIEYIWQPCRYVYTLQRSRCFPYLAIPLLWCVVCRIDIIHVIRCLQVAAPRFWQQINKKNSVDNLLKGTLLISEFEVIQSHCKSK